MSNDLEFVSTGKLAHVRVSGKLTTEAYKELVPVIDQQIDDHGRVRILFEMHDFHGWTAGALWEDLKFDLKHWRDVERLAIVGDSKWQEGMAVFCKPFTSANIQYFDQSRLAEAQQWIEAD